MSEPLESLPDPPYYAVIFTSQRSTSDDEKYAAVAERMNVLASQQPGFLGMTSLRDADGRGVTISYWSDTKSIANWRQYEEHRVAQKLGRREFYDEYRLEICRVERVSWHIRERRQRKQGE